MTDNEGPQTSTISSMLLRHIVLIATCTVAAVVVGALASFLQPRMYTAELRVFLSSQAAFVALEDGSFGSDPSRYLDQQAAVMTSEPLLESAIEKGAAGPEVVDLKRAVEVIPSAESDVLTVRASASDPEEAAARADALVAAYRDYQEALVRDQVAAVREVSNADDTRRARQRAAIYGDGVGLVEDASVTRTSSLVRNALVLGLVGLLLGSAAAVMLETRRRGRKAGPGPAQRRARGPLVAEGWGDSPLDDKMEETPSGVGSSSTRVR